MRNNIENSSDTLRSRWVELKSQWQSARSEWNDPVALRFEREFWSEWESILPRAIEMLGELELALDAADKVTETDMQRC